MEHHIQETAYTTCPKEIFYQLLSDIDSYHTFLPFCIASNYQAIDQHSGIGNLKLAYGLFQIQFSTRNTYTPFECIESQLEQGAFKHLQSKWLLENNHQKLKIQFQMCFSLNNWILNQSMKTVLKNITQQQIKAFIKQAEKRQKIKH